MSQLSDAELLAAYWIRRDPAAMEHIVRRHIGFVYASALRQVRGRCGAHLADDITQAVFIVLTRKASRIRSDVMLRDWLFVTTRYAARNALRAEARRRRHEMVAAAQRKPEAVSARDESMIQELSPLLDEGIAKLNVRDRRGVLLSFFDNRTFGEIGNALGVSEDAARKRVARAVDKLRRFFISRGVTIDSTALASSLRHVAATSVAPAALVSMTVAATRTTAAALSIAKGTETIMTLMKFKSIAATIAICCATGVTISAVALTNIGPGEAQAAPPTTSPANGRPAIARFADDMTIEVLGVAETGEGKWWTANGAPASEQCDADNAMSPPPSHQVCARVDKLPEGSSVVWKTSANMWSANPARRAGADVPGLFVLSCEVQNKKALDITCRIASGEWLTLASCKATGSMCSPFDRGSVAFAPMYEQDGGTCASIAHDITGHQVRARAIDADGNAHPAITRVINAPGKLVQMNLFFELPMDKIDKVEFQIRPYDHVATFKGITLDPANPSQVQVTTGDKE